MGYFSFSPIASPRSSPSSTYSVSPTTSRSPSEYSSTASCAFPSWPRRQSLNDPSTSGSAYSSCSSSPISTPQGFGSFGHGFEYEVTNYVSDDDLFPEDIIMETRETVASFTVGSLSRSSSPLEQMDGMKTMEGGTVTASETIRDYCRQEREKENARREAKSNMKRRKSSKKGRVSFSKVSMTPIAE